MKFMTTVRNIYIYACCLLAFLSACQQQSKKPEMTPWGTTIGEDSLPKENSLSLDDIQTNGELIMLTISGPETYYDYHGHGMGAQYLLCQKFADKLGVSLRVEICQDTTELVHRMQKERVTLQPSCCPRSGKICCMRGQLTRSLILRGLSERTEKIWRRLSITGIIPA